MKKTALSSSQLRKEKLRVDIQFLEKNPDKIWEFNGKNSFLIKKNKKIKLNYKPEDLIEKIIEDFKFETPKNLPKICSLISGYFSYDAIRYIEKF